MKVLLLKNKFQISIDESHIVNLVYVIKAIDLCVSFEPLQQPITEMDGYIECEAVNSI